MSSTCTLAIGYLKSRHPATDTYIPCTALAPRAESDTYIPGVDRSYYTYQAKYPNPAHNGPRCLTTGPVTIVDRPPLYLFTGANHMIFTATFTHVTVNRTSTVKSRKPSHSTPHIVLHNTNRCVFPVRALCALLDNPIESLKSKAPISPRRPIPPSISAYMR